MTAVEDLDEWQQKTVPVTESADLLNLEKYAQYAIAVAAKTKTVHFTIHLCLLIGDVLGLSVLLLPLVSGAGKVVRKSHC